MRKIGYDEPCFIIAEAGINHNGDLEQAKWLAESALFAGADAVKFQTFTQEEVNYPNITYAETIELKEYCDEIGILFLSTPHSYSAVELLQHLVSIFKVASPFVFDWKFMNAVLDKGKPVIVSFNEKARHDDIRWLMDRDVYPLHTVCRYPADGAMFLNLACRQHFYWQKPWGYSDHCVGIQSCLEAVEAFSVVILEKHIKVQEDCVDTIHSIRPQEFKQMVDRIREMEATETKASCSYKVGVDGCVP